MKPFDIPVEQIAYELASSREYFHAHDIYKMINNRHKEWYRENVVPVVEELDKLKSVKDEPVIPPVETAK